MLSATNAPSAIEPSYGTSPTSYVLFTRLKID